jgi:precorrin-6B methylase 1
MAKLDVEQATKEMIRVAEAVLGDRAQMKTVRELIPENALLFPGANDKEASCHFMFKRRP